MAGRTVLTRDPRVLSRMVGGGFLLLGPDDDAPIQVTGAAAQVWSILADPRTAEEVVAIASAESGLTHQAVAELVAETLELLADHVAAEPEANGSAL